MDDSRGVYNHEIVLPTKKYPIMLYFHAVLKFFANEAQKYQREHHVTFLKK